MERLQRAVDVLTGLFNWVVLRKNTQQMVRIACQPCHAPGRMLVELYVRLTTGKGPTFWGRKMMQVKCPECRVEVTTGLLLTHCHIQNGVGQGYQPPPLPYFSKTVTPPFLVLQQL